jgi:hypothetical protein
MQSVIANLGLKLLLALSAPSRYKWLALFAEPGYGGGNVPITGVAVGDSLKLRPSPCSWLTLDRLSLHFLHDFGAACSRSWHCDTSNSLTTWKILFALSSPMRVSNCLRILMVCEQRYD